MRSTQNQPIVALFSPSANAVSETFIQAHKDNIDSDVKFYTKGHIPTQLGDQPILRFKYQLEYFLKKKIHGDSGLSLDEFALMKSLQEQKPDVVLCEYGDTAHHSLKVIKKLGIPMLVYFHGYDLSMYRTISDNREYADVIGYASKLFVVSKTMEKKIRSFGAKPEQIVYNPYGPNEYYFNVKRSLKPKQQFIAAGRLTNKKAPHLTILAFRKVLKKYPKAKLIIAGDGDLHQVCRDLINYYNIQKNVELPGVFNKEQLKKWLEQSAAFVQHSVTAENGDQEGTPVAVLEALASGTPVVSTKHTGINDIIVNNKTGYLVDEYDVDNMASKMILILDEPAKSKEIGAAGREFIRQNFTFKLHIEKINQIIHALYENQR